MAGNERHSRSGKLGLWEAVSSVPRTWAVADQVKARVEIEGIGGALRVLRRLAVARLGGFLARTRVPEIAWGRDVEVRGRLIVRGRGKVTIGDGCVFDGASGVRNVISVADPAATVTVGRGTYLNGTTITAANSIVIGEDCILADCTISDFDAHPLAAERRIAGEFGGSAPVMVGNRCWIGSQAYLLKGVSLSDESVIGARAVVRRSILAPSLLIGNPEQVIGAIDAEGKIHRS